MKPLRALYYVGDACTQITLVKAILAFDELVFCDQPTLPLGAVGTATQPSSMRQYVEPFAGEGYKLTVLEPTGSPVEDDLKSLVDVDLSNPAFREGFDALIHNDPYFLNANVQEPGYGEYGDRDAYRQKILALKPGDIPASMAEIAQGTFGKDGSDAAQPAMQMASLMAFVSWRLNFAGYATLADEGLQLFGDSPAMDMMLKAKFASGATPEDADEGIAQNLAYLLTKHAIPLTALNSKTLVDFIHFKRDTADDRLRFQQRIGELTADLRDLSGANKWQSVAAFIDGTLLPEVRSFQESLAKHGDTIFKDVIGSATVDAKTIVKELAAIVPVDVPAGLLGMTAGLREATVPHLVEYLAAKSESNRQNPYAYLLQFGVST